MLDEATHAAARDLARRYRCSVSEAIRRAVLRHHESVLGVSAEAQSARRHVLDRMIGLFDGNDAAAEVARLKREDESF